MKKTTKKTAKTSARGQKKATRRTLSENELKQVSGGVDYHPRKHLAGVKYEDTTLTSSGILYK